MEERKCLRCRNYPAVDSLLKICFPCSEYLADKTVMDPMILAWAVDRIDINHVYRFIRKEGSADPEEEFRDRLTRTLSRAKMINSKLSSAMKGEKWSTSESATGTNGKATEATGGSRPG